MISERAPTADRIGYKLVAGGNVPGGHLALWDGKRRPFITPSKEMNSIGLRYSDVVVDIGAYVGMYAIRCARYPVKQVVAYEPTPQTYEILSLTELRNLRIEQAAVVADDRATVPLHISSGIGVTNSIALSRRKAKTLDVPAVSYESAVAGASIVKIDVEGGEYDYPIVQPGIRALIIDFHPLPGEDWISKAEAMIASILVAGFEPVVVPDWSNGWTRAGSWIRPMKTTGLHDDLMAGDFCCGCGAGIRATIKALCPECYSRWSPKHRRNYAQGPPLVALGHEVHMASLERFSLPRRLCPDRPDVRS